MKKTALILSVIMLSINLVSVIAEENEEITSDNSVEISVDTEYVINDENNVNDVNDVNDEGLDVNKETSEKSEENKTEDNKKSDILTEQEIYDLVKENNYYKAYGYDDLGLLKTYIKDSIDMCTNKGTMGFSYGIKSYNDINFYSANNYDYEKNTSADCIDDKKTMDSFSELLFNVFDMLEKTKNKDKKMINKAIEANGLNILNKVTIVFNDNNNNIYFNDGNHRYFELLIEDNLVNYSYVNSKYCGYELMHCRFYISNPDEIVEYINNFKRMLPDRCYSDIIPAAEPELKYDKTNISGTIDLEKMKYNGKDVKLIEELDFEFTADRMARLVHPISQVTNIGDTVKCKMQQISIKEFDGFDRGLYLLIMDGSKGRVIIWTYTPDNYTSVQQMRGRFTFSMMGQQLINGEFLSVSGFKSASPLRISGEADDKTILSVNMSAQYRGELYDIPCKNVNYKYYLNSYADNNKKNLYMLFCQDEEAEKIKIKEREENLKNNPPNPEKIEVRLRGEDRDKLDYKILCGAQVKLDIDEDFAPKWYKELGKDVTATILCISRTFNGKKRPAQEMIRLKGSKGTLWFDEENSEWKDKKGENADVKETEFSSLISFDGVTTVWNSVKNDLLYASFNFTYDKNDKNKEFGKLENVEFNIEGTKITVMPEEIEYVGGGRSLCQNMKYDPRLVELGEMEWEED